MCKNRIANLIIIFVTVLFAAILGVSTVKIAYAEATINYQTTIKISGIEEGRFAYGNEDRIKSPTTCNRYLTK